MRRLSICCEHPTRSRPSRRSLPVGTTRTRRPRARLRAPASPRLAAYRSDVDGRCRRSCARSAEDRRTRFPHHNTTLPKGSGIARGGKETAGPQVNVVPEWHLRSARDSCLSRENHQALPTDAGYAAQAGMAEMACRAAACCRAASAPRRAERACGAGRLAYEPCGRQKAMQAAPRAGPAFGQFQYPTPPLHPDATAIAAAGDSLTAFLSVHRSPNGPQLRAVPNPARSTINMKKTR